MARVLNRSNIFRLSISVGVALAALGVIALSPCSKAIKAVDEPVFPGKTWVVRSPEDVKLDAAKLKVFSDAVEGRGCVVRHGYMVYTWGDQSQRGHMASATKPLYTHLLFKAVEDGRLPSVDARVADYEPSLSELNPDLDFKDRNITFRHLATQTSCYGVGEAPGEAFNYNDWQMGLFVDVLLGIFGATYDNVDETVLHPLLTDILQCQDNPSLGASDSGMWPGTLRVSVRDFARFGLLYLNQGNWDGTQLISETNAMLVVSDPLPLSLSRTAAEPAEMCLGRRSFGSHHMPDDQFDHDGCFSWSWWVNGIKRDGKRKFPSAPADAYVAIGNAGKRALWVFPSLDMVVAMTDTVIRRNTDSAMKSLLKAVRSAPESR
jgi:CubicO group peptidase (beta-lactamase class C family)